MPMASEQRKSSPQGPRIYRDPYHYELIAQMTAPNDLPYYQQLIGDEQPSLLELGCGTGRLCRPLARRCAKVAGIDNSEPLLEWCRSRAAIEKADVTLLRADISDFDLSSTFDLITLPYNTLNHLCDDTSLSGCFASVRRHLAPGGRFVIDTFNPDPSKLSPWKVSDEAKILEYIDPVRKKRTTLFESTRYDTATQVNTLTHRYEVKGEPHQLTDKLEMRIFFPRELDLLLDHHGFTLDKKLGYYDGRPFDAFTQQQLCECRAR